MQNSVADLGFPRDVYLLFGIIFAENRMKMNKKNWTGAHVYIKFVPSPSATGI